MNNAYQPLALLRIKDVKARVAMSKSQIYEMAARGKFPRPHKTSVQCARWLASDIDDFILAVISGKEWSAPPACAAERSESK